jgi:hypothetical protein
MQQIHYYIDKYIESKLFGINFDASYGHGAIKEAKLFILEKLKEINKCVAIDIALHFNNFRFLLTSINVTVEIPEQKIIIRNDVVRKNTVPNSESYIQCIKDCIRMINNNIEEYKKSFRASGEFILLDANLYYWFTQYIRHYDLLLEDHFEYYENLTTFYLDKALSEFGITAKYILPIKIEYACSLDEIPPIQFEEVNGYETKIYCIKEYSETGCSEYTRTKCII